MYFKFWNLMIPPGRVLCFFHLTIAFIAFFRKCIFLFLVNYPGFQSILKYKTSFLPSIFPPFSRYFFKCITIIKFLCFNLNYIKNKNLQKLKFQKIQKFKKKISKKTTNKKLKTNSKNIPLQKQNWNLETKKPILCFPFKCRPVKTI